MIITNKSKVSGKVRSMELDITEAQLNRYNSGRFTLQDCFPNLSADERESLLSPELPLTNGRKLLGNELA